MSRENIKLDKETLQVIHYHQGLIAKHHNAINTILTSYINQHRGKGFYMLSEDATELIPSEIEKRGKKKPPGDRKNGDRRGD
jgi:hypothetical protein